jgi:predicted unusual protein kinase regulating ubiquinone biosynthesis (AarF/ABC1/UbiB family)
VLHRGIEDSVGTDLGAFKSMLVAGRFVRRPREELDAIFAEVGARIEEELDYRKEADNLETFGRFFANDPDVAIPSVFRERSTSRVLTMSRLEGVPLAQFREQAPEAVQSEAGVRLGSTFLRMLYQHRSIHADPHPGNYLFRPDGRIGLLDFGCVRSFEPAWIYGYGACGMASRYGDREACMANALAIGALSARDSSEEDILWDLCWTIGAPFRGGDYTMGGPEDDVLERAARISPKLITARHIRAPRELVFLHRGLGGSYQIARSLKARTDWGRVFEEIYTTGRATWEASTR